MFQQFDADPEASAFHGESDDMIEDLRRDDSRIEAYPDTVLQDGTHLRFLIV